MAKACILVPDKAIFTMHVVVRVETYLVVQRVKRGVEFYGEFYGVITNSQNTCKFTNREIEKSRKLIFHISIANYKNRHSHWIAYT